MFANEGRLCVKLLYGDGECLAIVDPACNYERLIQELHRGNRGGENTAQRDSVRLLGTEADLRTAREHRFSP